MARRIAALLVFVAAAAVADHKPLTTLKLVRSGMLLLRTSAPGFYNPAQAVETHVALRIRGPVLRGEVTQRFRNPESRPADAVYAFPLPVRAAVDRLRITAGDRILEGEIEEQDADKVDGNLFTASIANVGAGEEVTVAIEFQQIVESKNGTFRVWLPASAGTQRDLQVDLDFGIPLRRIDSPHHQLEASMLSASHYLLSVVDGPADRDFELTWQPEVGDSPQMALFTENNYALLMLLSPETLTDLEVRFDDPAAEMQLLSGQPLLVVVKFTNPGGRVIVSSGDWQEVRSADITREQSGIAKFWARAKIEELTGSSDPDARAKIVSLGLEHHLVTRFTRIVCALN